MIIAIIPARKGSKRIKNKNIKIFYNKPIIYYSIKTAINSKIFDKVFVSTDCSKIANISRKYGAEVPFLRDEKLSDDYTVTSEVIKNFYKKIKNSYKNIKFICCIYPANPLLSKSNLIKASKILLKNNYDYVFSATKYQHPIQRAFYKTNKKIFMYYPNYSKVRTQDIRESYHDAGQFYFGKVNSWLKNKKIFSNNSEFIEIARNQCCDIDNSEDWNFAKILFKNKGLNV
tara:strand:- start:359 stop:1048 length:690 start_codon:yes stop_codon:yes gene_type:complete